MNIKKIFPFALTALVTALTACGGGGSTNVKSENDEPATTNGSCSGQGCVQWGLEYPLDGLNFNCSSDTKNNFITQFNRNDGVATGRCKETDEIEFYIASELDTRINIGKIKLSDFIQISGIESSFPRLSLLDISAGQPNASSLNLNDPSIKKAMNTVKVLQTLALEEKNITDPTDIQPLYINEKIRERLNKITKSINVADTDFESQIKPVIDITKIKDEDAFKAVSKLAIIANAAVYQPEFSLFSTDGLLSQLSGSNGLVGCDKTSCSASDKNTRHVFGHFMLITDRQGYTFGSGVQWRDKDLIVAGSNLTSLGGINAEMIRKVKPVGMTALPQKTWLDVVADKITSPYQFNVGQSQDKLEITQGTLLSDSVIAGTENFYKLIVKGKVDNTPLTAVEQAKLGKWRMSADNLNYNGSVDLYKIFPISYLDGEVFKTASNVAKGQKYIFPIYGELEFKFTDTTHSPVKVGVVIDSNGDVRTNRQSETTLAMDQSNGCQGDVLGDNLEDANGVTQYRLGTLGRAFAKDKTLSIRMVLGHEDFGDINGALIGVDSRIETSTNANDSIVIGGALINVSNLLNSSAGQKGRITFTNSAGEAVGWANTLASFQNIYNTANKESTSVTDDDKALAKLNGGTVSLNLANCYTVKQK
ncbi:hypothetical protein BS636_08170 [Acinetobacter sp. LoGeW2-3]|uniref:putative pilus system protein FilF n=1 Tax=Acinetobacter sp. LoGeW2-3 TaxID=1808001 RepID=UPI000C05804A|nr:hypothetical protein [Acinetobacter sp. LoGeW2-3]ATO19628.1 hypothetical protein BS636_08170 [Acinetobacter sp. LoGeW2-3]